MNAFNNINLAGTCVLTSTEYAKEIGIPDSKWIYPLGGAGTSDSSNCEYLITIQAFTLMIFSLGTAELLFQPHHL
jgi:hypothetical protein